MTFVLILLIAVFVWFIFGDRISAWLRARMMRKFEDTLRRQMGMPTRKEEERMRRQAQAKAQGETIYAEETQGSRNPFGRNPFGAHNPFRPHKTGPRRNFSNAPEGHLSTYEHLIQREYAVDVEYVEIREYSSTSSHTIVYSMECQMEDASFTLF